MLNNMKIATRLLIGFGIMVLMVAGLSGYAIYSGHSSSAAMDNTVQQLGNETLIQRAEKRLYVARMHVFAALATGDAGHWRQADKSLGVAREHTAALRASTRDVDRLAGLGTLDQLIVEYQAKIAPLRGRSGVLESAEGKAALAEATALAEKMVGLGDDLGTRYRQAGDATSAVAMGQLDWAVTVSAVVGCLSFVLGILLAVLIGRSITRPVVAMVGAMGDLAADRLDTEVPALDRKDEIGAMAQGGPGVQANAVDKTPDGGRGRGGARTRRRQAEARRNGAREAAIVAEVAEVAKAASGGDLDRRIDLAGKDGFLLTCARASTACSG